MHTYVGGITNAPGSIGFEHVLFAPPAQLIRQALGAPSMRQTRAAQEPGAPLKWASATRETGRGTFALFWSLNLNTTYAVTCAGGIEGTNSSVSCPHSGIEKVKFALNLQQVVAYMLGGHNQSAKNPVRSQSPLARPGGGAL